MTQSNDHAAEAPGAHKVAQYLLEAHASELMLVHTLAAHIAMTPAGRYRTGLETHLKETRDHALRLQRRLRELDGAPSLVQAGLGAAQGVTSQVVAMTKFPMDLARGMSGEERLLKNAKDECASEALEIATYTAIEQLAVEIGDSQTERLAASIRKDEERMLELLLAEIPRLTTDVVSAELEGASRFDLRRTGAVDAARFVASTAARSVSWGAQRFASRTESATAETRRPARAVTPRSSKSSAVKTVRAKR